MQMLYFDNKKDFKSIEEVKEAVAKEGQTERNFKYTDPYNIAIQWLGKEENKSNENYKEINLLVNQYYYGIEPKKELKRKLISIGVLTAKHETGL